MLTDGSTYLGHLLAHEITHGYVSVAKFLDQLLTLSEFAATWSTQNKDDLGVANKLLDVFGIISI